MKGEGNKMSAKIKCKLCPYEASSNYGLFIHCFTHQYCSKCNKKFDTRKAFFSHMENRHGHIRKCDICNNHFATSSQLNKHKESCGKVKEEPIDKIPLVCAKCPFVTLQPNILERHEFKHNYCFKCTQDFAERSELLSHLAQVHERKIDCEKCGKQLLFLKTHIRTCQTRETRTINATNKCTKCEYVARIPSEMIKHHYKHNSCFHCELDFEERSLLIEHLNNDHGRPINCPTCNKNWLYLKYHMKTCGKTKEVVKSEKLSCKICNHQPKRQNSLVFLLLFSLFLRKM